MTQTAVDFLVSEISKSNYKDIKELIRNAKLKEREQIINAWDVGRRDVNNQTNGEEYYKQKFNTNDTSTVQ